MTSKTFTPIVPGIIHITGEPDVGKTTFALQSGASPQRMAFLDDDGKERGTAASLEASGTPFKFYKDLKSETAGLPQLQVFEKCLSFVDELEKDKDGYDAIVWDTWTRFAGTLKAYVRKNPAKFRESQDWAPMGQIKGAQQWKEAQEYEAQILARLNTIAPVVLLVTHLKNQYIGSRQTGKQIPDASRTIVKVPAFRVWLRRNPSGSPVPVALVLKRIKQMRFVEGEGLRTVNVLPPRVQPQDGDNSVWDAIARYVADPVGDRELLPHEMPNSFERSLIEGTMTDDQKKMWMLMLAADVEEENGEVDDKALETAQLITELREEMEDEDVARELRGAGKGYRDIRMGFKALGEDISTKEIVDWCKND